MFTRQPRSASGHHPRGAWASSPSASSLARLRRSTPASSSRRSGRARARRPCRASTRSTSTCSCRPAPSPPVGGRWRSSATGQGGNKEDPSHVRGRLHGGAGDRHHRHQRRRARLRPARHADGQPAAGGPVTFSAGGRGIDQNGDGTIGATKGLAPPRRGDHHPATRRHPADGRGPDAARPGHRGRDGRGRRRPRTWTPRASTTSAIPGRDLRDRSSWPSSRACGPGCSMSRGDPRRIGARRSAGRRRGHVARRACAVAPQCPGITASMGCAVGRPLQREHAAPGRRPAHGPLADGTTPGHPVAGDQHGAGGHGDPGGARTPSGSRSPATPWRMRRTSGRPRSPGVPAKSVIVQFAKGDQTCPEPDDDGAPAGGRPGRPATCTTATTWPSPRPVLVPKNPHGFMVRRSTSPAFGDIALGPGADRDLLRLRRQDGHPPGAGAVLRGAESCVAAGS